MSLWNVNRISTNARSNYLCLCVCVLVACECVCKYIKKNVNKKKCKIKKREGRRERNVCESEKYE